jgi:hypothetical protein
MSVLDLGAEPVVSAGLGRPSAKPVVSAGLGRQGSSFSDPVAVNVAEGGWKINRWNEPANWLWDLCDVIAEAAEAAIEVAKLLSGTVVGPLWRILCAAALRAQPRRAAVTVKPTLTGDATFVLIYIGDHNCICADLDALLENTKGKK